MVTNNFAVRLEQVWKGYQDTEIIVVSNDVDVNMLAIKIFNNGVEIDYSQIESGTITFVKDDNNVVQGNLTINASDITYLMGTNEIAIPGMVRASIQLYGASNERLTPAKFRFRVENDLVSPSAVESTTEFSYLQQLKAELEAIDVVDLTNSFNSHKADIATFFISAKAPPSPLVAAVGDGISDDTDAIQAIISAVNNAGKAQIYFPIGTYLIGNIDLTGFSNIKFICAPGTIIKIKDSADGFNIKDTFNIIFDGFDFDGSLQIGARKIIHGSDLSGMSIKNCSFRGGFWGVFVFNANDSIIKNCKGYNFAQWPFYIQGCDNFKLLNNKTYDNGYDGLKIAGTVSPNAPNLIKNVIVAGNISYNNTRDGLDIAGANIENVQIYGNVFYNNTERGIDVKNVNQNSYVKNIKIYSNTCVDNIQSGIGFQVVLPGVVPSLVDIYDNQISKSANSGAGIRLEGYEEGCRCYNNQITNHEYGIRLIDSNNSEIFRNTIRQNICIRVETIEDAEAVANKIFENDLKTALASTTCIHIVSANVKNTDIYRNSVRNSGATYRITNLGTNTSMYMNEAGYAASVPSGRATKGEIWWNTDPSASGYIGWVATNTQATATFKGFGAIEG